MDKYIWIDGETGIECQVSTTTEGPCRLWGKELLRLAAELERVRKELEEQSRQTARVDAKLNATHVAWCQTAAEVEEE